MSDNIQQQIEQEVQRRLGNHLNQSHSEIAELRETVREQNEKLVQQNDILKKLLGEPLIFGTLISVKRHVDPRCFARESNVIVCDKDSEFYQECGTIISDVDEDGYCDVKLFNENIRSFSIGAENKAQAQIKLVDRNDGTSAIVYVDGKPWEIKGISGIDVSIGDTVKIKPDTKAIISRADNFVHGQICNVISVTEKGVEVQSKSDRVILVNPKNFQLEEGDRVVCDHGMFFITEKLNRNSSERYKLKNDLSVTWDDVGGLDDVKSQMRDALELPFTQPELFKHYGVQPTRGVLLHGCSGCGKTLIARAAASAIAKIHGKESVESGYIYVKSPEILSKWVGNTEAEIRELFERGRRHFREQGYKGILAFDEADAIMPQRGTRRSSDVSDTIVPMFLGEMDGIDEQQTKENPIVILMTNRADILDPAITRPGRISKHIKVGRPTEMTAIDILEIHTKNVPFKDEKLSVLAVAVSDLFSKSRVLYKINNQYEFTLGDAMNGAMLSAVAESAKMIALHRDLSNKTKTGITIDDIRQSVNNLFLEQRGLNHSFDVADFAESHGLQANSIQVERCFGAM